MTNNATPTTLQDLLNLVVDPTDPLKVGTGVANYRAALNCITRLEGMPSDMALIPADPERILTAVSAAIEHGSTTKKIPKSVPSRLKTLFEKASITTTKPRLSAWEQLRDFLDGLADELGIAPKTEPDRVYRRRLSSSLSGYFSRELCVVKVPFCGCG